MNTLELKLFSKSRIAALVLVTGSAFGLLAACSNDSNSAPSTPIVNTGGGGSGGGNVGGGDNSAGDNSAGESNSSAGSAQGGSTNGGAAGAAGEAGAGEGGEAGSTGVLPATCPSTDLGFLNQPSSSQKQPFNDVQRLGTYTTLPPLGP